MTELDRSMMEGTFDDLFGLQVDDMGPEEVRGHVVIERRHLQPAGIVHGGLYASMAESLTSMGTYLGVVAEGKVAMGLSNNTSFLRPVSGGTVRAHCRRRHAGRTTWLWEVDFTDDEGRLCAVTRMTIAVREPRS